MSNTTFLPYAKQSISTEDLDEVRHALTQPIITRGALVDSFEQAFAAYCNVDYAIAFNSGTAALMAGYFALDIGPNDHIISTPNTFISTIGAAVQRGANPIFIDIERTTGNLNLEHLLLNLNQQNSRGKTVVTPVHFSGIPVDVKAIDSHLKNIDTYIFEDAAHAIGSCYADGSKVGSCLWSQMTMFSFHPAKTMTTGEGGMITTNDKELNRRLRLFRNNCLERDPQQLEGIEAPWYYEVGDLSGNYNFTEMQAALGLSQLKRLDQFVSSRQKLMQCYKNKLKTIEHLHLLGPTEDLNVAPHLCVVHIDFEAYRTSRTAVMDELYDRGIGTQLHYIPLYRHPFFANKAGDISEYFPEMERHYAQGLSLPLYADLTEEDVERVVKNLKEVLQSRNHRNTRRHRNN